MEGLRLEWERSMPLLEGKEIVSVYFGGGTPALLGPKAIGEILGWVDGIATNTEITLEANPENVNLELMQAYADVGINRISIGIQTLDDALLPALGRLHNAHKAMESVLVTFKAGISNISVDLMYDLPGQTLQSWQKTLDLAGELPITHLSLYNLTIEPHTVFFKYRKEIEKRLPDADASLEMYETAIATLERRGLKQYEISAFARDNLYSRHNVGYWIGRPFLGFGPSAFSYWEGRRFRNVANLSRYCKALQAGGSPVDFEEELDPDARRGELLAIHLRLLSGVNLNQFQAEHGRLDATIAAALEQLENEGFLSRSKSGIALTHRGMLFYDTVAAAIV